MSSRQNLWRLRSASIASIATRAFRTTRHHSRRNIAASFPWRGLARHQGAGLYVEVAPRWVWVGGGMCAPDTSHLARVREHIAANHTRLRAIVESPGFRKTVGALDGQKLQRVPRGFTAEHPAAELPAPQAVPGREGVPCDVRARPEVLCRPARRVPAGGSAGPVSQRAADVARDAATPDGVRLLLCLPPSMAALACRRPSTNRSAATHRAPRSGRP